MADTKEERPTCFVIMPIKTPTELIPTYRDDSNHFVHVLDSLFIPAIESAGYEPLSPISTGSDLIHADIINNLNESDLVLCDMSTLNSNVFFEFGIRTALNKPVALTKDDLLETIPFDAGLINCHTYESALDGWKIEEQRKELSKHIADCVKKTPDYNALWKRFGIDTAGSFTPGEASQEDKLDLIQNDIKHLINHVKHSAKTLNAQKHLLHYRDFHALGPQVKNQLKTIVLNNIPLGEEVSVDEVTHSLDNDFPYMFLKDILKELERGGYIAMGMITNVPGEMWVKKLLPPPPHPKAS